MSELIQTITETKNISLYPQVGEWSMMNDMAKTLISSGMLPSSIDTPQKAMAVMLKGRELGIPAMQSFTHIYVVEGKPACSSELMLALMARGGVSWEWLDDGRGKNKCAVINFSRQGFPDYVSSFSYEDAEKIVKYEKGKPVKATETYTWKQYLPNMLRARAISNGARVFAPDLIGGMSYTVEELIDHDSVNAIEVEVKEVNSELAEANKVKLEKKKESQRASQYKKILNAVEQFGIAVGNTDAVKSYFSDELGVDLKDEDPCLTLEDLDPIEDLEAVLSRLRVIYKEVKETL